MFGCILSLGVLTLISMSPLVPKANEISDNVAKKGYARSLAAAGYYTLALDTLIPLGEPTNIEEALELGDIAIKASKPGTAVFILRSWVSQLNESQFWLYLKALETSKNNALAQAIVDRLKIKPKSDLLYKLAEIDKEQAFNYIIANKAHSANMGLAHYEILSDFKPNEAEEELKIVLELDPKNLKALHYKGEKITNVKAAIVHYLDILQIYPNDYATHRMLHRLYYRANKPALAEKHKIEALRIKPSSFVTLEDKALRAVAKNKPREALKYYTLLKEKEPENIGAMYSVAGLYSQLGEINTSLTLYSEIVKGPNATLEGIIREIKDENGYFFKVQSKAISEDAPSRLANVVKWENFASINLVDPIWNLAAGPVFWLEKPKNYKTLSAQGARLAISYRVNSEFTFSGEFTSKVYNQALAPTFSGSFFGKYSHDFGNIELGISHTDELHNEFAYIQKTQGTNLLTRINLQFDRLELGMHGRGTYYSDNNLQFEGTVRSNWIVIKNPGVFKVGIGGSYINTQYATIEAYTDNTLSEVTHPYWTPTNYLRGTMYVDWEQDLAHNSFSGQNQLSYSLSVFSSYDNTNNLLFGAGVALNWEVMKNWKLKAAANIERSEAWNGASLTIISTIKF